MIPLFVVSMEACKASKPLMAQFLEGVTEVAHSNMLGSFTRKVFDGQSSGCRSHPSQYHLSYVMTLVQLAVGILHLTSADQKHIGRHMQRRIRRTG